MLLFDDAAQQDGRSNDRHLTFHHRHVKIDIGQDLLRASCLFLLRVEQNLTRRSVERRFLHQENCADQKCNRGDSTDEFPLAPDKAEGFNEVEPALALADIGPGVQSHEIRHLPHSD